MLPLLHLAFSFSLKVFENEKTVVYRPEILAGSRNIFREIVKDGDGLEEIVYVYDVGELGLRLCNDMKFEHILCYIAE